MRLDKFIANNSDYSRAMVRKLVKQARVHINNVPAQHVSDTLDPTRDSIQLDGKLLNAIGHQYFMHNKACGYVCSNKDDHPTVIDLFSQSHCARHLPKLTLPKMHCAGRLDIDTTGLVLISNDGELIHRVTAPRAHKKKCYQVTLAEPLIETAPAIFAEGLLLKGESKITRPAKLKMLCRTTALVELSEGRYHQVKRMFAALNNRVTALHRIQIADITLDDSLAPGSFRPLNAAEIACI